MSGKFLAWVEEAGIKIHGVESVAMPGKGTGMVAQLAIKKGDIIATVPATALVTVDPEPKKKNKDAVIGSVHGRMAEVIIAGLASSDHPLSTWLHAIPSQDDVFESMPVMWEEELQSYLSRDAKVLLVKQQKKLASDLTAYASTLGHSADTLDEKTKNHYIHAWLLVNTRSFYWDYPLSPPRTQGKGAKRRLIVRNLPPEESMALCPFIDFFNHADEGDCPVSFSRDGYTVTAGRDFEAGDELHVSYGRHSNDYLLVEYGFYITANEADHTTLDDQILRRLTAAQKELLSEQNFLGNYVLDAKQSCHRTQVALRLLILPTKRWERFVWGMDDGEKDQAKVEELLNGVVKEYQVEVRHALSKLEVVKVATSSERAKKTIQDRWLQIMEILSAAEQQRQKQI